MTALAVLKNAGQAERHSGHGLRDKYRYFLPLVGRVCRDAFCRTYGISTATVGRYRERIKGGNFAPKAHGNRLNKHAKTIDSEWLIAWFRQFAATVGDVVPVRVRRQETKDGKVHRYFSSSNYTLVPAHFTWETMHAEMQNYVAELALTVREPAESTMRKILTAACPTIRIRSPRANVCDVCAIYHAKTKGGPTSVELTEEIGKHTQAARRMRYVTLGILASICLAVDERLKLFATNFTRSLEYKNDLAGTDGTHAVIAKDFSQNLTLPSVSSTPSQWYFLSLWAVNMLVSSTPTMGSSTTTCTKSGRQAKDPRR